MAHPVKYTLPLLRQAIETSTTWEECCRLLNAPNVRHGYIYPRKVARKAGISTDHLDAHIGPAKPPTKYTKAYLEPLVAKANSWSQLCAYVKVQPADANIRHLQRKTQEFGLSTDHIPAMWSQYKRSTNDMFRLNSGARNHVLKARLFSEGIKSRRCERCGITEWMGFPVPLELDHIDSNPMNNELDNLQVICPNCHAIKTKMTRRDSALERQLDVSAGLFDDEDY